MLRRRERRSRGHGSAIPRFQQSELRSTEAGEIPAPTEAETADSPLLQANRPSRSDQPYVQVPPQAICPYICEGGRGSRCRKAPCCGGGCAFDLRPRSVRPVPGAGGGEPQPTDGSSLVCLTT